MSAVSVNAGEWTVEDSVNRTNRRPVEYTSWLGTIALREAAALDSDPYLPPDLRCTLQPRVGMPAGRSPMENEDSARIHSSYDVHYDTGNHYDTIMTLL